VLQVPAARCACLLKPVGRLGAFFTPERLRQIRLYLTAGVSVADVGSDVLSVSVNYLAGKTGLASALLATVLLSLSFQILIVVVVHRHQCRTTANDGSCSRSSSSSPASSRSSILGASYTAW
jgi:hypothetical protein